MTSAEYCRMGEFEDVGTVGREYVRRLFRMGAILWRNLWEWNGLSCEHFVENQCVGRRGRGGRPDLVGRRW